MIIDDWKNCYGEGWKGILNDAAFSHPAKFSRALIRRIYRHAIDEGWLREGDCILDPFGGIAAGAYDAMRFDLHWYGCELEPRFCDLGRQNILKWNAEHKDNFKKWGSATLLQGDSRRLCEILRMEAECCVSSPPYAGISPEKSSDGINLIKQYETYRQQGGGASFEAFCATQRKYSRDYGNSLGQLSSMREGNFSASISSPPYAQSVHEGNGIDADKLTGNPAGQNSQAFAEGYGKSDGQLAKMPEGKLDAAISSPPYAQALGNRDHEGDQEKYLARQQRYKELHQEFKRPDAASMAYGSSDGQLAAMPEGQFDASISSPPYNPPMSQDHNGARGGKRGTEPSEPGAFVRYGNTPGQLEGLPMDGFDASVSSPPWEANAEGGVRGDKFRDPIAFAQKMSESDDGKNNRHKVTERARVAQILRENERIYGNSDGQIGIESGETFWSAAKQIVEQVHAVTKQNAKIIWVVKDYVRNKQRVPFCERWMLLCESVGFKTLHWHRAWLVEDYGTQQDLLGAHQKNIVQRKSFFRRLYEKKYPENKIDFEVVLCMEKK